MVTFAILALLAVVSIIWWIMRRRRSAYERDHPLPPLIVLPQANGTAPPPRPPIRRHSAARGPAAPRVDRGGDLDDDLASFSRPRDVARFAPPPVSRPSTPSATPTVAPAIDEAMPGATVEGHLLRFHRPADGTLQFLPGRLEVVDGRDAGHEIRFVRTMGADGTRVTFGRSEGPPYRHVQLREQTVSRRHAVMSLEGAGLWRLTNLSETNPVVVNGVPLSGDDSEVVLRDGDRIEMGEVAFLFRER